MNPHEIVYFEQLEIPGKCPIFGEQEFDFRSIYYSTYRRFIELLSAATNHFFRKTSTSNYVSCLDIRGIEAVLTPSGHVHGRICPSSGGLHLNLNQVPAAWTRNLVGIHAFSIDATAVDENKLNFVKKYNYLHLFGCSHRFVRQLIHPNVAYFTAGFFRISFAQFVTCLEDLSVCQNLEDVCIHMPCKTDVIRFTDWRTALEQFYQKHKHSLKGCTWCCAGKQFKIHENQLCYKPTETGDSVPVYVFEDLFL